MRRPGPGCPATERDARQAATGPLASQPAGATLLQRKPNQSRARARQARLAALTAALGGLNGRLREVHLSVHIAMRAALSAEQRAQYARQRGYQPR